MKTKRKYMITYIITFITAILLPLTIHSDLVQAANIKINYKQVTMIVSQKLQLKITGTKKKITWKSSNPKTAIVSQKGVITAKQKGNAKITATIGKKKYSCKVTVELPKLNKTNVIINCKEDIQLKVTGTKQKISWKSLDENVVTVSTKGTVTGIFKGGTVVTATVGKKTYQCSIIVEEAHINYKQCRLEEGRTIQLEIEDSVRKWKWKSSNGEVAEVSENGLVTSKKIGVAEITATAGNKVFTTKITVAGEFEIENGVLIKYNGTSENVIVPQGITTIGRLAFVPAEEGYSVDIKSVVLPDTVTTIEMMAFQNCTELETITWSKNLITIGENAFAYCMSLTTVELPTSLKTIEKRAFTFCMKLDSITIPDSVVNMGEHVFQSCDKITIHCTKGSYAYEYAQKNNVQVVAN